MSEKRFTIVGEEYVGYMQGNAYIISNGECKFSLWERKEDAQKVCDYLNKQQATITELERKLNKYAKIGEEQLKQIIELQEENEQLRRLFEEMKQPITINLTEKDEKELRKLLGLIDDE